MFTYVHMTLTINARARELMLQRRRRGWGVRELARRCGLSAAAICQIETGKRQGSDASWQQIAKALRVEGQRWWVRGAGEDKEQ